MHKCLLLFLIFLTFPAFSQHNQEVSDRMTGYWEGAFIKNNAYQKIEIEFSQRGNQLFALQIMDEWHPTFGEFEVPVEIDSSGQISFNTGYGKAELLLDQNNLEITGQLAGQNPAIYVHLKKAPDRLEPAYSIEKVSVVSEEVSLSGHLHLPFNNPTKTAIILVGGRGCYADETRYNLYAKFFRKYGIATLAYQKRGTGSSTGDCSTATIDDLARDLGAAKSFLASHEQAFENIGVLGISAGGWTMTKAAEDQSFDFMIGVVGPSTSVRDQQLQSASYRADFYQLTPDAKANLLAYTRLMFDAPASEKGLANMQHLLELSKQEGWRELLEDTDIPSSTEEISQIWVRRHNFDPASVLQQYKNPFLAIYGDRDWIVPWKENMALLNKYFQNRTTLLSTIKAYNAEHGMEMESRTVELTPNHSYWHFYRVSPEVRIGLVDFLRKHEFMK